MSAEHVKVTVGVCGGIAAYKSVELVRLLQDAGTGSDENESSIEHIHEAQTTSLLIVAPATADMLAKFAHGLADDFLSTMFLATTAPVMVAPAMNVRMWEHPATRANVETLRARGVTVIEPGSGYLACGMVGGGRLAEPAAIVAAVGGRWPAVLRGTTSLWRRVAMGRSRPRVPLQRRTLPGRR